MAEHQEIIALDDEDARFVRSRVDGGGYASASEVVHEGLRLLAEYEKAREAGVEATRRKIEAGLADADAGRVSDGPAVMRRLIAQLRERAASQ